jgi:hypothetical protein
MFTLPWPSISYFCIFELISIFRFFNCFGHSSPCRHVGCSRSGDGKEWAIGVVVSGRFFIQATRALEKRRFLGGLHSETPSAGMWGMARTFRMEERSVQLRCLDLDTSMGSAQGSGSNPMIALARVIHTITLLHV